MLSDRSKKTKTPGVLIAAVIICLFILTILFKSQNVSLHTLATGIYTEYHQLYTENESAWGVECAKALTKGSFRHRIAADNVPESLQVTSSCESGTLILHIRQNDTTESYHISNTADSEYISLSWLESGSDVQLSVEHTAASNICFSLIW